MGTYITINIFDYFYVGTFHCIDLCLRRNYIYDTYNIIFGPVHILANHHLLSIQYSMG